MSGCSNDTRGVFGGGYYISGTNKLQYITIDTTGNATNFGNLAVTAEATQDGSACSGD